MSTYAQLLDARQVDTLAQIELALAEVRRMCQPGTRWHMTIPVDVDDSDVVIAGALVAARDEIRVLRGAISEDQTKS